MGINEIYWSGIVFIGMMIYILLCNKSDLGVYPGTEFLAAFLVAVRSFFIAIFVISLITKIVFLIGLAEKYGIRVPNIQNLFICK